MNMNIALSYIDSEYMIKIRRKLHMFPEIGFKLPRTLELIKSELDHMGVSYTEKYGRSSIVAVINNDKPGFTIALRADTDALPIQENNNTEYKSCHDGIMHACGHDAHTAILLGTVKALNSVRDMIHCRMVFLFQASEEKLSGANLMVEDGVTDEFDCIIACHVENTLAVGTAEFHEGPAFASCDIFKIELFGKAGHAATPHKAVDTISMGVRIHYELQNMVAREIDPLIPRVLSIGVFKSGTAFNILPEYCLLEGTIRTYSSETVAYIKKRMEEIVKDIAIQAGGSCSLSFGAGLPAVVNDAFIARRVYEAALHAGVNSVYSKKPVMYSEDFAHYLRNKPGAYFFIGSRNVQKGIVSEAHSSDFDIDEDSLETGAIIFTQFVFDCMDGI